MADLELVPVGDLLAELARRYDTFVVGACTRTQGPIRKTRLNWKGDSMDALALARRIDSMVQRFIDDQPELEDDDVHDATE